MNHGELSDKTQHTILDRFLADNQELEELSDRLGAFNVFRALKIEDVEIRHSNALAWLLDPRESHGLGDIVLRRVLSNVLLENGVDIEGVSAAKVELMDLSDVEVFRERYYIDVLVTDATNKWILIIENKIHAGEGNGQLKKYRQIIKRDFGDWTIIPVYLTLDGETPTEEEYLIYSHVQLLSVLEKIERQKARQMPSGAGMFLTHYIETLRRLTMQDEKLIELCQAIYRRHRDAIDLIVEYGQVTRFQEIITELFDKKDFEILCSGAKWIWFIPRSWSEILPENGVAPAWQRLKRHVSVCCWIAYESNKIKIVLEVSAMTDPKMRLNCVKELQTAGFKLNNQAFDENAIYSRFFTDSQKISDKGDDEEIQQAAEKLLAKAREQFPKGLEVFKKVFGKGQANRFARHTNQT